MSSNSKFVYLHAGSPKTGTSSLQSFLAINSKKLSANNFHYPSLMPLDAAIAGDVSSGNGEHLARSMLSKGNPERIEGEYSDIAWGKLKSIFEQSASNNIIISSEYFFVASDDGLAKLKKLAESFCYICKPLIWIRPQWELFYSAYAQLIKTNKTDLTLLEYLEEFLSRKDLVKYHETLGRFSDIFGFPNIVVRRYQKGKMLNDDICADFSAAIGLTNFSNFDVPKKAINPTPTYTELELLLGVSRAVRSPEFGAFYSDALRSVRDVKPFEPYRLDPGIAVRIFDEFFSENALICDKYFPGDSELFFFESEVKAGGGGADSTSLDSSIIVLAAMIAKIDQRLRAVEQMLTK